MSEYEELFETRIRLNERIAETESYIKLLQEQLAELKTLRENLESLRGGVESAESRFEAAITEILEERE